MNMLFPNENQLIQEVQAGNKEAFRPLYHQYITPVYRFILSQIGHREDAEDLTSHTFLKAVQAIGKFRFEAKFQSWLFTIARYTIHDYWRAKYKQGKEIVFEDYMSQEVPVTEENLETHNKAEAVTDKILKLLPPNYRQILKYRFIKNYSIKDTAKALKLSEENVKVLQHRALKKAAQIYPLPYATT